MTGVTTFRRRGHWRTEWRTGEQYWVGEHDVSRDDWDRGSGWSHVDYERAQFRAGRVWPKHLLDENVPNARCPVCGDAVWFFRNENGGCAYFDAIGRPWPKHPCMDSRYLIDRTADWQARRTWADAYPRRDRGTVNYAQQAYDEWAAELLGAHILERDIRKAEKAVDRTVAATQKHTDKTSLKRKRRERVRSARERLRDLRSEVREAKRRVRAAEARYKI